jgi:CO/xanthine dehydrogenase FAD-binding subunit
MTMQSISKYHRPPALDEAIALLGRDSVNTVVIAGGTVVAAADLLPGTEVVDIQSVVRADIERQGDRVVMGGMARLQDVLDNVATPPLLAELARREGPNTLRHASTVGGAVAEANPESELLAGLLVHDAEVTITKAAGTTDVPLPSVLADPSVVRGGIITSVSVAIGGETASARTGRTPADTSIVSAIGRVVGDGLRVALTGVANTPVLIDPAGLVELDPPADFRGSSAYRKAIAWVLTKRVTTQLGGTS